jgi:Cu2+-exporting ATPase
MSHAAVACSHCGLPVPAAAAAPGATSEQFCCNGCRAVWSALHDAGLSAYYDLASHERASANTAGPAHISGRGFEHLDHLECISASEARDGTRECRLRVEGLHCGACVWLLEALPGVVPGLVSSRVMLGDSSISLQWGAHTRLSTIAQRFDRLGYQLAPLDANIDATARRSHRRDVLELGVAGAISVNAMGLAFALYSAHFDGMDPSLRTFVQWWSVALAALAVAWPGRHFFHNALTAVRARVPHMDIPVSFGLACAVIAALVATIRGTGSIYAEGVSMLVFLLLVGRFVQRGAQRRAMHRIESAMALLPATARRVTSSGTEDVLIDALRVGDTILVPAHESVGADGTLLCTTACFDRSHLTGESKPVECFAGDWVDAGSRCLGGSATIRVARVGSETRAAHIGAMVRDAAASRAPICQLADRLAGWFLLTVLVLATWCVIWWVPRVGWDAAMERTVALLVVTCPCALGLATPLAVLAGIGSAARRGVLIKSGESLERLGRVGTLILDKTGTLTLGSPRVVAHDGDYTALALAAALELHSTHPAAQAIVRAAVDAAFDPHTLVVTVAEETPGEGVRGVVSGHALLVGSARLMRRHQIAVAPNDFDGASRVYVAVDGEVRLAITLGDPVRPDATETVRRLRQRDWRVMLASGDTQAVATAVARAVGIPEGDSYGELSPEDKLGLVHRVDLPRPVVMVGDGINDLVALAAADCGVAVRGGAQSAARAADACLAAEGIAPLATLLDGARRTMTTIHLNLVLSLAYNAAGAVAAWIGLVNPIVASVLMPLSGLTVLATSMALARPREDLVKEHA